jgi:hypothetical protein
MAEAADKFNDLIAGIGASFDNEEMRKEYITNLLKEGRALQEIERTTVRETSDAD